jgi:hypothetical protein
MKYSQISEKELEKKVSIDWFKSFDCTRILGNIDFCVSPQKQSNPREPESLLWAEAKTKNFDTIAMFAQLIITIGKERTFDKHLPPAFLGVFDFKKMVFVPYNEVSDLFYLNDFNWNVTPSNHDTKEFHLIKKRIQDILSQNTYEFDFIENETELKFFIKHNLSSGSDDAKILIDKNNFVPIYLRWLTQVKPHIDFDWTEGRKQNILDSDFFLADLFVDDKGTASIDDDTPIKHELFVVFKNGRYVIAKENLKSLFNADIGLKDKNKYEQFWKKYRREPLQEFQQYIIDRRDLLIPQDVRERKGAFFTPQIWVELSQKYLAEVLGENWQDEYYVWDCAAGTGNLLVGLTNKYNVWASTLDQADVNVIQERINNGANLLPDHVFQFDFLNDDFSKLPQGLQNIIHDPEKRKKLVVYINPPYAEATTATTVTGTGANKSGVATNHTISQYYKGIIGNASNEIFALFMARIYEKLPNSILGQFSKLKFVNGSNFRKFKTYFMANFLKGFVVPAITFDNVKGTFPIGFTLWNLNSKEEINTIYCDVFDSESNYLGVKEFYGDLPDNLNKWIKLFDNKKNIGIGYMGNPSPDFQHNSQLYIYNKKGTEHFNFYNYTNTNLLPGAVYFTCRNAIEATWLNDRDQFLFPNEGWKQDKEFQNDCLAFTLFHSQNRITSAEGTNHWIPFTEQEVNARDKFESNFMTDFMRGKLKQESTGDLFAQSSSGNIEPLEFSETAQEVFAAGLVLWRYYHQQIGCNVNASLYDIREHFQGRNDKGKMNNKSEDEHYMELIGTLRAKLKILADKIAPKVYEYGFLKA